MSTELQDDLKHIRTTGQLQKAIQVLEEMPFQPDYMTLTMMLSSCHNWGYLELARYAFECAIMLDEEDV